MKTKRRQNIVAPESVIEHCAKACHREKKYILWALKTQAKRLPKVAQMIREWCVYEGGAYQQNEQAKL